MSAVQKKKMMKMKREQKENMAEKTPEKSAEKWVATFGSSMETAAESVTFIKRMIFISISYILFFRDLLPKDAFNKRKVEGVKLFLLRQTSPAGEKMRALLLGVMEALEKRYLREILLLIYDDPNNRDKVVEVYTMSFAYGEDGAPSMQITNAKGHRIGPELKYRDAEGTRRATLALLQRTVILVGSLSPLPDGAKCTLKLSYFDHRTPPDYEPPGFTSSLNGVRYHFEKQKQPLVKCAQLGQTATKHHGMTMAVETLFMESDQPEENNEDDVVLQKMMASNHLNDSCSTVTGTFVDNELFRMPETVRARTSIVDENTRPTAINDNTYDTADTSGGEKLSTALPTPKTTIVRKARASGKKS